MRLYHFTCADHGDPGIQRSGVLRPNPHPMLSARPLLWLTDLDSAITDGLGLTSDSLTCNRTAVRYEVDADAVRWVDWARANYVSRAVRDVLERYGLPMHWWLVEHEVPVVDRVALAAAR